MILYLQPILYILSLFMPFVLLGLPSDYFGLIDVIRNFIFFSGILASTRLVHRISMKHFASGPEKSRGAGAWFISRLVFLALILLGCLQLLRPRIPDSLFVLVLACIGLGGAQAALLARGRFLAGVLINLAQMILAAEILYLLRHEEFVWQTLLSAGFSGAAIAGWEAARLLAKTSRKPTSSGRALEIEDPRPYSKAFVMLNRGLLLLPCAFLGGLVVLGELPDAMLVSFLVIFAIPKFQPPLPAVGQPQITLPQRFLEQALAVYMLPGLIFLGLSLLLG